MSDAMKPRFTAYNEPCTLLAPEEVVCSALIVHSAADRLAAAVVARLGLELSRSGRTQLRQAIGLEGVGALVGLACAWAQTVADAARSRSELVLYKALACTRQSLRSALFAENAENLAFTPRQADRLIDTLTNSPALEAVGDQIWRSPIFEQGMREFLRKYKASHKHYRRRAKGQPKQLPQPLP